MKNSKINAPLLHGEKPLKNAPSVELDNGGMCIPQHYLQYNHTRQSVESLVCDMDYNDRYLIFVCEDQCGIYLQIGIIGFDNYLPLKSQKNLKVVYGRKWRVEPQLPTSEIIQTVFLALKKAREHEIRELFCISYNKKVTTPFNNHHDLPLFSQNADLVLGNDQDQNMTFQIAKRHLDRVRYDLARLRLKMITALSNGKWLIEIDITASPNGQLPEIIDGQISFLIQTLNSNELYYQLMDELIRMSDRHVDENFHYKSFARFSRKNNVTAISDLSFQLRLKSHMTEYEGFSDAYETAKHETDQTRIPTLGKGALAEKIRSKIFHLGILDSSLS